jgi:CheY-like chemotaxis protein/signal recognition particle receptor subunit beta
MAFLNHAKKEITVKLVYYGPGLCGKTTNLQWLHQHVEFQGKGKLLSLATEADRTLFFDFLPVELAPIRGMKARVQIYTVPGQVFYDFTRKIVLREADGVVFVADSQAMMLDANLESLENLRRNLIANDLDPELPLVFQYNKRDLPNVLPVAVLNDRLNKRGAPFHEAVAIKGIGVAETLRSAVGVLFRSLSNFYQPGGPQAGAPPPAPRPTPPAAPTPRAIPPTAPAVQRPQPPPAPPPAPARPRVPAPGAPAAMPAAKVTAPARPAATVPPAPTAAPARRPPTNEPAPPEVPPPAGQWLYLLAGKRHGPVHLDDLLDLLLTSLPEETPVWGPRSSRWMPANVVPEITEHIPPPLPLVGGGRPEEDFPDFNTVPHMLRTALIADEDASFRHLLALPLAAQGFKTYEARDGAEAWRLANEQRPWLMLADLGMPEVDGFEFCRRVRANSLLSHRPLVFISGSDRYKDRYRAMQLGADDFLSKQTPIRELLIRIQLLLTRYSDLETAGRKVVGSEAGSAAGALEGQIEVFGAPGVLQICNQGRLTGIFTARAPNTSGKGESVAVFGFRDGEIVTATVEDLNGPPAVYAFLAWKRGLFKFAPGDPGQGAPLAQSVEHLLLEGCRLIDESRERAGHPRAGG